MRVLRTPLVLAAVLALLAGACTNDDADPSAGSPVEGASAAPAERGAVAAGGVPAGGVAALPAGVGADGLGDGVTVAGAGRATGAPDVVRVAVGVEVQRNDAQTAIDDANASAAAVLDALDAAGVAPEDRQTRDFSITPVRQEGTPPQPQGRQGAAAPDVVEPGGGDTPIEGPDFIEPDFDPDAGDPPQITAYVVRNLVEATVRDIDAVGQVIEAAAEAGGDDALVQGVTFALEEDSAQLAAAREAAVEDARATAEQYAQLVGATLGELVAIEDRTGGTPRTAAVAEDAAAAGVPIEPGEQAVTVYVVTRWALE